jgi:hypothetical protein
MKRKTILSCFAALLGIFLATGAFAQPWSSAVNETPVANPGTNTVGYAGSDTLFVCLPRTANVNLGVDVLSAYLPNTYGDWSQVYPTAAPSTNVFPMSGVTPGQTYIFKYTVTQSSCDLQIGDWLYAFVVAVPSFDNLSKDTTVCVSSTPLSINDAKLKASYSASHQKFLSEWSVTQMINGTPMNFDISTTGTKSDTAEIRLSGPKIGKYTCTPNPFNYYYNVHVTDSIGQLPPQNTLLCKDDAATRVNDYPHNYFGITVSGTWTALAPHASALGSDGKIDFTYLSNLSDGTEVTFNLSYNMSCKITANGTFVGKIKMDARPANTPINRGLDSAAFCKETPYTVYTLTNYVTSVANPFPVPSYWKFLGNTPAGGGSSTSPFTDGTAKGLTTEDSRTDEIKYQTGVPYFFRYTLDPTSPLCWAGDSGLLRITFSNPTGGTDIDDRADLCQSDSTDFNMNAYMGLPATTVWSPIPGGATVVNGVFKATQSLGNYVFPYTVPAVAGSCGGATTGKLYVSVTRNINATDVSVYYCVDIAPATVNLFSLLGISPVAGDNGGNNVNGWYDGSGAFMSYLTTATGVLDLGSLRVNEYPTTTSFTYTFTPDAANSSCVTNPVNVTILLGTTMP